MSVKIPKDDEQSKVKPNRNKDKPKISRIGAARIIQRFWRQHIVSASVINTILIKFIHSALNDNEMCKQILCVKLR